MNGERIAAARKAKGMSQRRLGELVGVSQQAISKYESPNGDIDGDTLISLAAALGVTISYLLGLTDEPGPTQVYEAKGDHIYTVDNLTTDEKHLVELYRQCTPEYRRMLIASARSFRDSSQVSVGGSELYEDVVNI